MNKPLDPAATVTRAEVEDLLYHEAELLDGWKLDEWLALLTDEDSLTANLLTRMGVDVDALIEATEKRIDGFPQVTGSREAPAPRLAALDAPNR